MQKYQKLLSLFALAALSVASVVGCGPSPPSRSEFSGEIVTEVPEVPGADTRYPLPALDEKASDAEKTADEKADEK